jgi:hypothetical protein
MQRRNPTQAKLGAIAPSIIAGLGGFAIGIVVGAVCGPLVLVCAGAVGGAAAGATYSIFAQINESPTGHIDWGEVGVEALEGAAIGAVLGAATELAPLLMM